MSVMAWHRQCSFLESFSGLHKFRISLIFGLPLHGQIPLSGISRNDLSSHLFISCGPMCCPYYFWSELFFPVSDRHLSVPRESLHLFWAALSPCSSSYVFSSGQRKRLYSFSHFFSPPAVSLSSGRSHRTSSSRWERKVSRSWLVDRMGHFLNRIGWACIFFSR